jgi:hypothetical protein
MKAPPPLPVMPRLLLLRRTFPRNGWAEAATEEDDDEEEADIALEEEEDDEGGARCLSRY